MRTVNLSLTFLFLIFVACGSEEKEFMTPKPGEIVLDVNVEKYSLNGMVLGKTGMDISSVDDLLINSIYDEVNRIRKIEQDEAIEKKQLTIYVSNVRCRFDENLSYDVFYKSIATMGFNGYTSIRFVIGSNYRDVYDLILPRRGFEINDTCQQLTTSQRVLDLLSGKKSKEEMLSQRVKAKECQIEHAKKYIDLSLSIESKGDNWVYSVGLNETGLTDGGKTYRFEKDSELWKFIDDVHQRRALKDKEDKDKILLTLRKGLLLKDLVPIIRKLTDYGYKINYAIVGG